MQRSRVVFILLLLCPFTLLGKGFEPNIRAWTLSQSFGWENRVDVDTSFWNLANRNIIEDYSISSSYNGNLISPIESRVWFERQKKMDFLFGNAYAPYITTAQDMRFYQTNTPFSKFIYRRGFKTYHDENDLRLFFTGNVSRKFNVGLGANYLNAVGLYDKQSGKSFNGSIFSSYIGDKYRLHAAASFTTLRNYENGGVQNPIDVGDRELEPYDLPINMTAMSSFKYVMGLLQQSYSIGAEREQVITYSEQNAQGNWEEKDSVAIKFVPIITFSHAFDINNSTKRYRERENQDSFYTNTFRNTESTLDTTRVLTISNTLSVTFNEEFNTRLKFGITAFARNECHRYSYPIRYADPSHVLPPFNNDVALMDSVYALHRFADTILGHTWKNSTFVGGALFKHHGRFFRYGFDGEVCLLGYKLGEFALNGHLLSLFKLGKDTMTLAVRAYIKNETPDYFLQNYFSNHYKWENDFDKTYRYLLSGTLNYPTEWLKMRLTFNFENVSNYIYFEDLSAPVQYDGNVQIVGADASVDITTPWINLDNRVVYQHASREIISVPDFILYHNLYYHGTWFKALDAQIGVDMQFFSKYYAPLLNPALGQFAVQKQRRIGDYPRLNGYINFYLKQLRLGLYAQYNHFNRRMMKRASYFAMPAYPYNPDMFKAGLHWHFYK